MLGPNLTRNYEEDQEADYLRRNLLFCAHSSAHSLPEKDRARSRSVNLNVTVRAVRILSVLVVLRTRRLIRAHTMSRAVARKTELRHAAGNQQARIGGTMRCVTRNAPFRFYWSMFVNKGTLLVDVTLDAGCVRSGGEPGLLQLETAVGIVAVATPHCSFKHLVMERQIELVLGLHVATKAQLRFARFQQLQVGETGFLRVAL